MLCWGIVFFIIVIGLLLVWLGTATTEDDIAGFGMIIFLVGIGCGTYQYLSTSFYVEELRATAITWERIIPTEIFSVINKDTSRHSMPSDAYDIDYYTNHYYVSATCYYTTGSGKDEQRVSYECGSWHTDYMARYKINRWIGNGNIVASGTPKDEIVWPTFTPVGDGSDTLGNTRTRNDLRIHNWWVHFKGNSGRPFLYGAKDAQEWRSILIERLYTVNINRLEQIDWGSLKLK